MILFIDGMPDDGLVRVHVDSGGQRRLLLRGTTNALPFLGLARDLWQVRTLYGADVVQPDLLLPERPRLIFNQISDPDTSQGALERCVQLVGQIGAPVINHPARVMLTRRHEVAGALQGIAGLRVPRTIRCEPLSPEDVFAMAASAGIETPFLVRVAGLHGGRQMQRVDGDGDVPRLHAFPFDGRAFYITEFLDFADAMGAYHKFRIAVVGNRAIARHALVGPDWNVHGRARRSAFALQFPPEHERVARVEQEFLPGLDAVLTTMQERLGLDCFGIDCSISERGEVSLFEANAAMNLFQNDVPGLNPVIDRIRDATRELIAERSGARSD